MDFGDCNSAPWKKRSPEFPFQLFCKNAFFRKLSSNGQYWISLSNIFQKMHFSGRYHQMVKSEFPFWIILQKKKFFSCRYLQMAVFFFGCFRLAWVKCPQSDMKHRALEHFSLWWYLALMQKTCSMPDRTCSSNLHRLWYMKMVHLNVTALCQPLANKDTWRFDQES